jgi:IclR family mhp operon transcriptional activator
MPTKAKTSQRRFATQTLERGLDALGVLVASPIGATPAEAAKALRISRPAAYRAMAGLESRGFVKRMVFSGRYVLSRAALEKLNARAVDDARLAALQAIMTKLGQALKWPISVAGPQDLRMVVWATTDAETSLTLEKYTTGFDVPMLESASGRVYLAHIAPRDQAQLLKRIGASKEPYADLARAHARVSALLKTCKRNGYAMTTHEPLSRRAKRKARDVTDAAKGRTTSLSVPVLLNGVPIACIAVRFFETAMPPAKAVQRYVPALKAAAADIAAAWAQDHGD